MDNNFMTDEERNEFSKDILFALAAIPGLYTIIYTVAILAN